ncbi:hypothetical protein [Candidatus Methanomassiliicoccus intestinalis]|uniref:hypothetical protein n=1 Tax=Candidatus Methanomassiliicoccus intestinalis TaxID=1406512 RepID=UPI0037DC5F6E
MIMRIMTAVWSFVLTMAFAAVISAGVSGLMSWFRSPETTTTKTEETLENH